MAAGGDQADEGRVERDRLQPQAGDVAGEVVDHHQRLAGRVGERLGRGDADQQRADQARALGDGHARRTSASDTPAASSASSTTALTVPRWWRAATSGTTPP